MPSDRPYLLERVDDAAIVQYYADGFAGLTLEQKRLIWHLYEAALAGRDIYYDQRYERGLAMRDTLEAIVRHGHVVPADALAEVLRYTKLFWLHSGPFHNLTARKFVLRLSPERLAEAARLAAKSGARFPLAPGETLDDLLERLTPAFFDPGVDPTVTCKAPPPGHDILTASANNLYAGVSMADLAGFAERYELNSRLVKRDGGLVEEVYRVGGRYGDAIARIVSHLEAARPWATPAMASALDALVRFYRTGEVEDRRAFDIAWVADAASPVDTINGFIEVYMDARGCKGSFEAIVSYVNVEKTRHVQALAGHAQWFEDRMPWHPRYRKPNVTGVSARAIDVVVEAGDAAPMTPIGVNLPNDQAIREQYGSKSVSLSNVLDAYERSTPSSLWTEFSWSAEEAERARTWSSVASELATNLHEIIGHGSGLVNEAVAADLVQRLKEHYSSLEETRADLVALYFIADRELVSIGIVSEADHDEVILAEYEGYARNALVQLRRVREGHALEEDHMRNRQAIVHWLMANSSAVQRQARDGKTYYVMTDARAFRTGVAALLAEVQRIKAEADYEAAAAFFTEYGSTFDPALRDEIVARSDALDLPAYTGFVQPVLEPTIAEDGSIVDVAIGYPCDFTGQMLSYSERYRMARSWEGTSTRNQGR